MRASDTPIRILYAATIFLGALLLFSVQPLIARFILPWFGGAPAVWTTCMLFFQVLLLLGYLYANLLTTHLRPRAQAIVHGLVLGVALLMLPIIPSDAWKPTTPEQPIGHILLMLGACIGVPYFVLSATSPLLQAWHTRVWPEKSPYPLYAVSNLGSLLALLSYPFVIEPMLSRRAQAQWWAGGLAVFAVGCVACARYSLRGATVGTSVKLERKTAAGAPGKSDRFLWVMLSACASMLFLAVTNKICQDVAVIPFLWIVPLSIYLISFILSFAHRNFYPRMFFMLLLAGCVVACCLALPRPARYSMDVMIGIFCITLFVCCMICHGELARLRPDAKYLTSYYLFISIGGALGGAAVSLGAPVVFRGFYELHLGLAICLTLVLLALFHDREAWLHRGRLRWAWAPLIAGWIFGCYELHAVASQDGEHAMIAERNFYGALLVELVTPGDPQWTSLVLRHGGVVHGIQLLDPGQAGAATSYYTIQSGVGVAFLNLLPVDRPRRVGAVGLGAGTIAAYARPGDVFRFYEINPAVIELASRPFTFIGRIPGAVQIVRGDARLSMEAEPPQRYDMLVLDAFSGDAIPVHLLTAEAFAVYQKHLAPGGIIAVHITNDHLDLRPVVHHLATVRKMSICWIPDAGNPSIFASISSWMLLSSDPGRFNSPAIDHVARRLPRREEQMPLWTDEHASLFEVYHD